MGAGEFTRKVLIESVPETQNSRGDPIEGAPTTFATIWAKYEEQGGGEALAGDQRSFASTQGCWKTRYLSGVLDKNMRINEAGVLYDIVRVDESGKRDGRLYVYTVRRAIP